MASTTTISLPEGVNLRNTFLLYKSSLKNFLKVNDVQDEQKKKGIFFLSVRQELQELLQRLCTQDEQKEMSCDELLAQLERVLRADELLKKYIAVEKKQEQIAVAVEPTPSGSQDDHAASIRDQRRTDPNLHSVGPMHFKDRFNKFQHQSVNQNLAASSSTIGVMAQNSAIRINTMNIATHIQERGQTAQNPLPYKLRNKLSTFCGRDNYLDDLTATLNKPDCNIVVVHGFSGVGKSELCNQYAWRNIHRYENKIIWIHAEHLQQELLDLARELDVNTKCTEVAQPWDRPITQITKDIYSQLKEKGVSLLVLDDVLTRDEINKFLPDDQHKDIRVLITSPYAYWTGIHTINLLPLTSEQSEEILRTLLKNKLDLDAQEESFKNLLKIVEGVPLAVQICGAYISYECRHSKTNFKLTPYVNRLLENEKNILEQSLSMFSEHEYNKTIYISFKTTLDKIKQITSNSKFLQILEILNVCAYLNAEVMPRSLLQEICQTKDLSGAIHILQDFSLIVEEQDEQVRMHKLIQNAILLHQEKYKEHSKWFEKVLVYFLTCNEHCEVQLASVLSHAQHNLQVVLQLLENNLHTSKLLRLLVIHDSNNTLKDILVQLKDVETVKELVSSNNLLHVAVRCNKLHLVETLLTYSHDLDRLDDEGLSPLLVAAARGLDDVAEVLMSHGAKMCMSSGVIEVGDEENPAAESWTTKDGYTLLHLAALCGHVGLCRHSLAAPDCNVNVTNKSGWRPMNLAAEQGHVGVLRCLLEHGASTQARNASQWSALHFASWNGHTDIAALLAAAPDSEVNALNHLGMSPLHLAAHWGHLAVVRVLCDAGARADVRDNRGDTPLDVASQHNRSEVCTFLEQRFPKNKKRKV